MSTEVLEIALFGVTSGGLMTRPERVDDRVPAEGETMFRGASMGDYVIDSETGCWNWQRGLTDRGYPSNKAHRHYYRRAAGTLGKGVHVHHRCKNPACVNPEHLEAIQPLDHFIEHHLTQRGMTLETVKQIREEGRTPNVTLLATAKKYGIGTSTVQFYWDDRRWAAQLDDEPVYRPAVVCELPECGEVFVPPRRDKRFCCKDHQALQSSRNYAAKRKAKTHWKQPPREGENA
jgi:hypothetical protein